MHLKNLLFILFILYANYHCYGQIDTTLENIKKVSDKYSKRIDTTVENFQKIKTKYIKKADSLAENLQKVPVKYLNKGDSLVNNFQKIPNNYVKRVDSVTTVIQSIPSKYVKRVDSIADNLQKIPDKYIKQVDNKIEKYSKQLSNKTEKTLAKLSRWESKIHTLLQKVNPEADARLFGNGQATFSSLLQKIKEGKSIAENYKAQYDQYRDKLTSSLKYIEAQKDKLSEKYIKPVSEASEKIDKLEGDVANSEAIQQFIKERKNRLIDESIKYIGKSKYLKKINKEAYYYVDALRNYKETFSDPKKVEEIAIKLLKQIPAFQKFSELNSPLSAFFATPSSFAGLSSGASYPIVNGLASRASLQQYMQTNIPSLGKMDAVQLIQNKLPDMQQGLDKIKKSINDIGGMGNKSLPDFKPNSQKNKPFRKRLEFGTDLQFGKSVNFLPATSDIALKLGYKINDKSSAGIGINYKMGIGNGWDNIKISSQGLGLRTYVKWSLKKGIDIQGGSEWNYMLQFNKIRELKNANAWQQSALIGLSKQYKVGKKIKGNIQALYDFLYSKHVPNTQPLVFRFGYGL